MDNIEITEQPPFIEQSDLNRSIVNHIKHLRGLDSFQLKIVNQCIDKLIKEYNINFEYKYCRLNFLIEPINIKLVIELDDIESWCDEYGSDFFNWIIKYINQVPSYLDQEDITYGLYHEYHDFSDNCFLENYDYLSWGVINKKFDKKKVKECHERS